MIPSLVLILSGNLEFHVNAGIAETQIIPKEYLGFWRMDCPQNAKCTKITKKQDFLKYREIP